MNKLAPVAAAFAAALVVSVSACEAEDSDYHTTTVCKDKYSGATVNSGYCNGRNPRYKKSKIKVKVVKTQRVKTRNGNSTTRNSVRSNNSRRTGGSSTGRSGGSSSRSGRR